MNQVFGSMPMRLAVIRALGGRPAIQAGIAVVILLTVFATFAWEPASSQLIPPPPPPRDDCVWEWDPDTYEWICEPIATATATATATAIAPATATPTATAIAPATATPTATAIAPATATPTATPSPTPSPTPTPAPPGGVTGTLTASPSTIDLYGSTDVIADVDPPDEAARFDESPKLKRSPCPRGSEYEQKNYPASLRLWGCSPGEAVVRLRLFNGDVLASVTIRIRGYAPAPSGLRVTGSTTNGISLSWNAVTDAEGYKLERRAGSTGSWSTVSTGSGTSAAATGLTSGTTYQFRVSARGDGWPYMTRYGSPSSSETGLTDSITPVTGTLSASPSTIDLYGYTDVVADVTPSTEATYLSESSHLRRSECPEGPPGTGPKDPPGAPAERLWGCSPGTATVTLSRSSNNTALHTITVRIRGFAPAPSGLSVTASTQDSISLSWTTVTDAAGYKLEQRRANPVGSWSTVRTGNNTSHVATGLSVGTFYQFRVSARGDGWPYMTRYGRTSPVLTRSTEPDDTVTPPTPPTPVGGVTGVLSASPSAIDKYGYTDVSADDVTPAATTVHFSESSHLRRSECPEGPPGTGPKDPPSPSRIRLWGCSAGEATVTLRNSSNNDALHTITVRVRGFAPPPALSVTGSTQDSISLSWNPVTDAAGYKLEQRRANPVGSWSTVRTGNGTSHTAMSLSPGTSYQFRVSSRGDGWPYMTRYGRTSPIETGSTSPDDDDSDPPPPGPTPGPVSGTLSASPSTIDLYGYTDVSADVTPSTTTVHFSESSHLRRAECPGGPRDAGPKDPPAPLAIRLWGCSPGEATVTLWNSSNNTALHTITVTIRGVAPAPGLSVTGSTLNSISLSWTTVTGAAGYKLEQRRANPVGSWSTVRTGSGTSHTAMSLSCGTTYQFQVSARGDGSTYSTTYGDPSPVVSRSTDPCPTIEISGIDNTIGTDESDAFTVSASNLATANSYSMRVMTSAGFGFDGACSDRQEDLTVPTGASSHTASLTLHRCSTSAGTVTASLLDGGSTAWTDSHAIPEISDPCIEELGTLWETVTRSGSWDRNCRSMHLANRPAHFYTFTLTHRTDLRIDLSSGQLDAYLLLLSGAGKDGAIVERDDDGGEGTNARIERELDIGTYTVEATTHGDFTGDYTLTIEGTAPAPTGLAVDEAATSTVTLSWLTVHGAERYKLERREGSSGSWVEVSDDISGTMHTARGLRCNTTYQFQVSARGDGWPHSSDFGDPSSSVPGTTAACEAPPPDGLRVDEFTMSTVTLSWDDITGAMRYKLERRGGSGGSWSTVSDDISGTRHMADGLKCNTTYHFRVSARGDGSTYSSTFGRPSASESATTTACPMIALSGIDDTLSTDQSVSFTVSATNLSTSDSYSIRVTTSAGFGFDDCSDRRADLTVPAGSASHTESLTLHRCGTAAGTVTATLFQGGSTVATVSHTVPEANPCITPLGTLSETVTQSGRWDRNCRSTHLGNRPAHFYTFTLARTTHVQIDLTAGFRDTYLVLLSGTGRNGAVIETDDHDGGGPNARIARKLAAGDYTIEATTRDLWTGDFELRIAVTNCEEDLGTLTGATVGIERVGFKASGNCPGYNNRLRGSKAFTFRVDQARPLKFRLKTHKSTNHKEVRLYLVQGAETSGTVIGSASESGGRTAELVTELAAGVYTLEAGAVNGRPLLDLYIDTPVTLISIVGPSIPVREGEPMVFTVTASAPLQNATAIRYRDNNPHALGTATHARDYSVAHEDTADPWKVTIPAGSTSATITITATVDSIDEVYETVVLSLDPIDGSADDLEVDDANSAAEGTIADLVVAPAISDDDSAAAIAVAAPNETSSSIRIKLPTSRPFFSNPLKGWNFANRAFVIEVKARPADGAAGDDDKPAEVDSARTSSTDTIPLMAALPRYANLGGQIVWVEPSDPGDDRYIRLNVSRPDMVTTLSHYVITVSKPDLAFIAPARAASGGGLTTTVRNSSGSDKDFEVRSKCRDKTLPSPEVYAASVGSKSDSALTVPRNSLICLGTPIAQSERVTILLSLYDGGGDNAELRQTISKDGVSVPFSTVTTLWHSQSVMGGLQIAAKERLEGLSEATHAECTSSFALQRKRLTSGSVTSDVSTTAHCAQEDASAVPAPAFRWRQGPMPLADATQIADNGLLPLTGRRCMLDGPGAGSRGNCRKGDHAYATKLGSTTLLYDRIFRPRTKNPQQSPEVVLMEYFETSGVTFQVVGARPPNVDDEEMVHKVGRSTGWTSGELHKYADKDGPDPFCPGNQTGYRDNDSGDTGYYVECLVRVGYTSTGGDSGSPVFVRVVGGTSEVEVILVGVHFGDPGEGYKQFIPIDRIYAESLREGYDWTTAALRPLPKLISADDGNPMRLNSDGSEIEAEFARTDFSKGYGLTYEAVLYRNGVQVEDSSGSPLRTAVSHDNRVASFGVSDIPTAQRNGTFSVKVRMCVTDVTASGTLASNPTCGGYHDAGASFTPASAPAAPTAAIVDNGLKVTWTADANADEYQLAYRLSSADDGWQVLGGDTLTVTAATVTGLTPCGADKSYQFRVRAKADASGTYAAGWGLWSVGSNTLAVPCEGTRDSNTATSTAPAVRSP